MTPEVEEAVEQLRATFADATVTAVDVGDGGVHVTISSVPLGPPYAQKDTWVKFTITFQYPDSDVYPLFVRPDLSRIDRQGLGDGIAAAAFLDEPAVQLSRRSNKLNPAVDTAATKVLKVMQWLLAK